jgi:hypothetical protein
VAKIRDIPDAYLRSRVATYRTYRKAGLDERAEQVARVLKARHGFDVADLETEKAGSAPEAAAADPMPEAAVEQKPQPASPEVKPTAAKKAAAKRTPAKPGEDK